VFGGDGTSLCSRPIGTSGTSGYCWYIDVIVWLFTKASCLPLLTCALQNNTPGLSSRNTPHITHPLISTANQQDASNIQHALFARPDGVADPEPAPSVVLDKERSFLRKGQHRYVMQPIFAHCLPSMCCYPASAARQPHVPVTASAIPAPQIAAQLYATIDMHSNRSCNVTASSMVNVNSANMDAQDTPFATSLRALSDPTSQRSSHNSSRWRRT
jgi:hypothetical protein